MSRVLLDTGIASDFINRRNGVFERARNEVAVGGILGICIPVLAELDSTSPETLMLEIITLKYQKNLPQIYRKLLAERPKMDGSAVLEAISISSLPVAEKRTLFLLGVEHENSQNRREARQHLKKLESK